MKDLIRSLPNVFVCNVRLFAAVMCAGLFCGIASADPSTIPTTVAIGPLITEAIGMLAAVVGVAVGGYIAFMLVRKGLRWLSVALR